MASNQFLLMALCFIIVGASLRIGISQYKVSDIEQNRIDLLNSIQTIATDAFAYRAKTANLGGGKASYEGFELSEKMSSNIFGSYTMSIAKDKITIIATSKVGYGTIAIAYDKYCKYVSKSLIFTGTFK